ncbi:sacsin N-terminal ATP-binding-like domain-containing protein [Streptomyces sp. NPDC059452]|uniref:sacsin N-terminal ATP-binding-like domain-containing protein n=1 Tax=Streptomyces sp. NPDC059452 TaxID=3346835 RepID=UPI00369AE815
MGGTAYEDGPGGTWARELWDYAQTVLKEWQSTQVWQPAQQLRAASHGNARDYAGRFLLELLQNGHDAHSRDRNDGSVHILLDEDEGTNGTLYVANGGTPFTWARIEAVCKLARSEKTVGEGIGNKGVGFRSILEVTDAPEVYSAGTAGEGPAVLGGYCFRFAVRDDLRVLLGDEDLVRRAVAELPPFQVPFPLSDVPSTCKELAADGHVTVIRIPLRNEASRRAAVRRLDELGAAKAPVMLFLDRLDRLVIERRGGESPRRTELTRREAPVGPPEVRPQGEGAKAGAARTVPAVSLARVELGPLGAYLVARGRVPVERLRSTIEAATELGQLDDSWDDWKEPAVVEVALSLDGTEPLRGGRLYTFLPLGEDAAAPLRGHLNAPFFTKVDRTALDREHPLNSMLFAAAAETSLVAAGALRERARPSDRRLAVDLVTWEHETRSHNLLLEAARRVHGAEFPDVPVVPLLNREDPHGSWGTPRDAVLWPELELSVLTAGAAEAVGIAVADPAVGAKPLKRLARLCEALKCPLEPSAQQRADHTELMVATLPLPAPGAPVDDWNGVYADLALLFKDEGSVLQGRKLLLADDGTLRRANGSPASGGRDGSRRPAARREAFFQPARGETGGDEGLAVPDALKKRMFYLHAGLNWVEEEGHVRRQEARLFLERFRLVRRFDATGLLDHVRRALTESNAVRLREQALRFVFRLYRSRQSAHSLQLRALGLYVPSAEGPTIKAADAAFGAGWTGTHGDELASVVAEGRDFSADLRLMSQRLVARPEDFLRRGETREEWQEFLSDLGVTDGLLPVASPGAVAEADGGALTTSNLISMAKLSDELADQWRPFIDRTWSGAAHPYTPYVGTPAFRLPGQDIAGRLSEPGRIAYARLVLHGLARWSGTHLTSVWNRDRTGNQDLQHVPTPLSAFVRGQPWIPVRGRGGAVRFVRPAETWHTPTTLEQEPAFAPTVLRQLRPLLEDDQVLRRLRDSGLPTWGDPRDSARLIAALGELVTSDAVDDGDRPALQRANERAWQNLAARADSIEPLIGKALLAEQGQRLIAIDFAALIEGSVRLYVTGGRDNLKARLARELKLPLLVVPGAAADTARILRRRCPDAIRYADDADLSVEVGGPAGTTVVGASGSTEGLGTPLVDELPWLPLAVGVLADHPSGGGRPTDAEFTDLVAAVRRIRIHRYVTLRITLDGAAVQLPERQEGMLPLPDPSHPLILTPDPALSWNFVAHLGYAVSQVLDRPEYTGPLKLAARELERVHAPLGELTERQLAAVLDVSVDQVRGTAHRLDGSLAGVLERCHPFLVHALGADLTRELTDPAPADAREFLARLEPHEAALPLPAAQLIGAARNARDIDGLRALADVDFADLNHTLAGLAPRYRPISHAEAHNEAVRRYVDLGRSALVDRLRWARRAEFEARRPIADWPATRSLKWITAPEEWAFTVDTADDGLLRALVEQALTARLGAPAPAKGERLAATDRLRSHNHAVIAKTAPDLVALVKAMKRPLPAALAKAAAAEEITALLDEAGALDFRELSSDDVVGWLAALGQWPTGLAASSEPAAHGLTPADLDRVRNAVEQARTERAQRKRIISMGDRDFDIESGDFTELATELRRALESGAPLSGSARRRWAALKPILPRRAAGPSGGRPGPRVDGERGLSSAQRSAIGFVGEWYAYQWLREQDRATDETSWVSGNRAHVFPGPAGDDSLGYDFEVGSGRSPRLYEVKATQGPGGQIELGETEVRAAQKYGGSDRWRILVVTSVLDAEHRQLRMLPNPFSERGRGLYREEGGALRFAYRL